MLSINLRFLSFAVLKNLYGMHLNDKIGAYHRWKKSASFIIVLHLECFSFLISDGEEYSKFT